jgi:hypothetical protein
MHWRSQNNIPEAAIQISNHYHYSFLLWTTYNLHCHPIQYMNTTKYINTTNITTYEHDKICIATPGILHWLRQWTHGHDNMKWWPLIAVHFDPPSRYILNILYCINKYQSAKDAWNTFTK